MKLTVTNIEPGTIVEGAALLLKAEELVSRKNTTYCNVTLTNGKENFSAKYWAPLSNLADQIGKAVIVTLKVDLFMGQPSYVLSDIKLTNEYEVKDFVRRPPYPEEFLFDQIIEIVKTGVDIKESEATLADLTETIYINNKKKLLLSSAAKEMHHAFRGGLLYHTYRMLLQAKALSEIYQDLDKEILYSAIALHDIGKIHELETTEFGAAEYTPVGAMLGHAVIGIEMVNEAVAELTKAINQEKLQCLVHCIASHHGKLEHGAITLPSIPEATAINYIDMMDADMMKYEDVYAAMEPGLAKSRTWSLDNVTVYKHQK